MPAPLALNTETRERFVRYGTGFVQARGGGVSTPGGRP
jgi:hypothetical protein